jgi:hypothetical protein
MEPDLQHRPNNRVTQFSLVDIPPSTEGDSTFIRKVCTLLEKGSKVVCVTKRSMGTDASILEILRDSLPGFVAVLDHHESSDIPVSLAKALSLGSDETDEKILQSRWLNFSEAIQYSTLPFTLIVPEADTLSKLRLTQINEFLQPLKGRLILADCGDIAKLFGASEAGPKSPSSDNNVLQFSDRGMEPEAALQPQSTPPNIDNSMLPEPPIITDEVLPDTKPESAADVPHTPRRANRNKKPLGWLTAGLGLGGLLGFLIANLSNSYGPIDVDKWINGIADGSLMNKTDQPALSSETASTQSPGNHSIDSDGHVPQKENSSPTVTLPMDAVDAPQVEQPITSTEAAVTSVPATPVPEEPATDLAALEKAPATAAAEQPIGAEAADEEKTQESELAVIIDPAERARLAKVYIYRAQSEWEMDNLQQSLLEIARGLDVDPDNQRLQELREQVLAELDARPKQ